jgi:hypothetical protein
MNEPTVSSIQNSSPVEEDISHKVAAQKDLANFKGIVALATQRLCIFTTLIVMTKYKCRESHRRPSKRLIV